MSDRTLLIVNCALDSSYENRFVLSQMYRDRFDQIVFTVSSSCSVDSRFPTIVQTCNPSSTAPCICENPELGDHPALRHSYHTRLLAAASTAVEFDYVMLTEDDCILSPRWNTDHIRSRCADFEALAPEIRICARDESEWVWAQHPSGYRAYDVVAERMEQSRLRRHGENYGCTNLPDVSPLMFYGFSDWFVVTRELLPCLLTDLALLQNVWHEAAIPTALMHNTHRIERSNGLPLWGTDRDRPLNALMGLLLAHDFVHAIKLTKYTAQELLAAYRAVAIECDAR